MFRIITCSLVATIMALFISTTLSAQGSGCGTDPGDPLATSLGSFTCVLDLNSALGVGTQFDGDLVLYENASGCRTQFEVCVWRTASNRIDYAIKSSSIVFTGDCTDLINGTGTVNLFNAFAAGAVAKGRMLGYGTCSTSCNPGDTCLVFQPSCVQRSGSGAGTAFVPCDTAAFCARMYTVCCPNGPGSPTIHQLPSSGITTCSPTGQLLSGCETTCP